MPDSSQKLPLHSNNQLYKGSQLKIKADFLFIPLTYVLPSLFALILVMITWEITVRISDTAVYILPAPSVIFKQFITNIEYFARHSAITLLEAAAGFILGTLIAGISATLMIHSSKIERTLFPVAILVKVTPVIAIAPLFVIWFGFGSIPKIIISALITFFPVMVNTLAGLRDVNPTILDLFKSLDASKLEIFMKLRLPSSTPYVFAAFRIAIPLSIIGAVVGEWFTGDRGLGSVIIIAHNNLDMPTLFSAIFALAFMSILFMILTFYIEKHLLFWHDSYIS